MMGAVKTTRLLTASHVRASWMGIHIFDFVKLSRSPHGQVVGKVGSLVEYGSSSFEYTTLCQSSITCSNQFSDE